MCPLGPGGCHDLAARLSFIVCAAHSCPRVGHCPGGGGKGLALTRQCAYSWLRIAVAVPDSWCDSKGICIRGLGTLDMYLTVVLLMMWVCLLFCPAHLLARTRPHATLSASFVFFCRVSARVRSLVLVDV